MNTFRERFPLKAAEQELRDFRMGKIMGPLTKLAMSFHDEQQNIIQTTSEIDPYPIEYPHYPLEDHELKHATPVRDNSGDVVDWVEWRGSNSSEQVFKDAPRTFAGAISAASPERVRELVQAASAEPIRRQEIIAARRKARLNG